MSFFLYLTWLANTFVAYLKAWSTFVERGKKTYFSVGKLLSEARVYGMCILKGPTRPLFVYFYYFQQHLHRKFKTAAGLKLGSSE